MTEPNARQVLDFFESIYEKLFTSFSFLPTFILLMVLVFKLATILFMPLYIATVLSLLVFVSSFLLWKHILPFLLNKIFFQKFLYVFYRIINLCLSKSFWFFFYPLSFFLALVPYSFYFLGSIESVSVILPNLYLWLLILGSLDGLMSI